MTTTEHPRPATASASREAPVHLTAQELSRAIHARELSCAEVMEAYLGRIDRLNPQVNAIVSLRPREELMAEAAAADAELDAGRSRGWMHGFPQAPKDLTATAGLRTTLGFAGLKDNVPDTDSILVARMRAAGAILIGKTNTPEFGLGSHTYNAVFGATLNAYDQRLSAGGSSGGAAVALACHLLPVADGSDMMGSLRNPAGWNNVFGFRPSQGRVPSGPSPELFYQQLATDGPMGRNMGDLAMLLSTVAGHDPRVPLTLDGDGTAFAAPLEGDVRGLRIGWLGDFGGYLPVEPEVMRTCETALATFEQLACPVEPARTGFDMARLWQAWLALRGFHVAGANAALLADPKSRDLLKPEAVWEIENGLALTGPQVFAATATRSAWYREMLRLFEHHDFLVLPTAQMFPFEAALSWPREVAGRSMDTYHRWMEVVIPATMAGLPTLAVPAGFGPSGLPMGLQIIGPPRADLSVLRMGRAWERAFCTGTRAPALV